jgi:hypothetical protein
MPQRLRPFEAFLFIVGLAALAVALVFGCVQTAGAAGGSGAAAGGASCGFAVAGGLCFLSGALLRLADNRHPGFTEEQLRALRNLTGERVGAKPLPDLGEWGKAGPPPPEASTLPPLEADPAAGPRRAGG